MRKRCIICGRPFDQILASQKTCSGTCERMRPALTSEPDEPEPDEPEPPKVTRADWRTCEQKGCGVDFRLEKKRGRPAKKCPQHRRTA